jgi:hypothetical protein
VSVKKSTENLFTAEDAGEAEVPGETTMKELI